MRRFTVVLALAFALSAPSLAAAQELSRRQYRDFAQAAAQGDKNANRVLVLYFGAMWNTIVAMNEANAAKGIKPVFCLPRRASPAKLRELVDIELARLADSRYAKEDEDRSFSFLMLGAIRKNWPCT